MTILYDYDPETTAGDVPSPCIGICNMDSRGLLCSGCFRSIEEITRWSKADNAYKRMVWREIKHRMFEAE
ncbi:MAG: DUF1289 domain-containing protein [Pseudomonadota bacterium]